MEVYQPGTVGELIRPIIDYLGRLVVVPILWVELAEGPYRIGIDVEQDPEDIGNRHNLVQAFDIGVEDGYVSIERRTNADTSGSNPLNHSLHIQVEGGDGTLLGFIVEDERAFLTIIEGGNGSGETIPTGHEGVDPSELLKTNIPQNLRETLGYAVGSALATLALSSLAGLFPTTDILDK